MTTRSMAKKYSFIFLLLICNAHSVFASSSQISVSQTLNFGTIRIGQPTQSATISVTYDGNYDGNGTNIVSRTSPSAGIVTTTYNRTFLDFGYNKNYTLTASNNVLSCASGNCRTSGATCSITVTPQPTTDSFTISTGAFVYSRTHDTNIGGQLSISAGCSGGTYNGQIPITVQNTSDNQTYTTQMNVQVILEPQPITISNIQDMDFGSLLSYQAHSVTISPTGVCTMQNPSMKADNICQAGQFEIQNDEPGSRAVTITLPQSINLINSSNDTLTLSSFNGKIGSEDILQTGNTITAGNQYIYIGATLAIPQGSSSGDYTGNYTVIVSY